MSALLSIKNLRAQYKKGGEVVFSNLRLETQTGKATALLGPNGCGKTTLIAVLAGLIPNFSGEIFFQGRPWTREALRHVAFVFDRAGFPPFMNATSLLRFFSKLYGIDNGVQRAHEMLELAGLQGVKKPYFQYSQGMRQRLAMALAVLKGPRLLILDEGLTFIDRTNKERMIENLKTQMAKGHLSILLATHSHEECRRLADEVLNFNELVETTERCFQK
ncbi:MAG: hypothetical protein A3G87_05745 [Omnitrophica bacterium RIFCSPLOWO2_12_FULL_50_11]|nr:MAG: hypothetical protein A3G87_05745 [Omnitrophica bacterium RIFCSPLOWO2_12_FULL_50_11]